MLLSDSSIPLGLHHKRVIRTRYGDGEIRITAFGFVFLLSVAMQQKEADV